MILSAVIRNKRFGNHGREHAEFEFAVARYGARLRDKTTSLLTNSQHIYEVRPRKDHPGFDLISDALPFGRLWYGEPNAISNAIGYARFYSRSHDAVIRVYDSTGNMIENARARWRFQGMVE
jgi:hypothetical protein